MTISNELLEKAANGYTDLLENGDIVSMANELITFRDREKKINYLIQLMDESKKFETRTNPMEIACEVIENTDLYLGIFKSWLSHGNKS